MDPETTQTTDALMAESQTALHELPASIYRMALDGAADAIYWANVDGRIIYGNAEAARSLGFTRDEIQSLSVTDVHPDLTPADWRSICAGTREGEFVTRETLLQPKDGTCVHAELRLSAIPVNGRTVFCAIVRDVTRQKTTEESLRESAEIFARAFRSSPHLVTITTLADGVFVDVNETFERKSGFSRDEIVGRTAVEMGVWRSEADRKAFASALMERGRVEDKETGWFGKSGERRVGMVSAELVEFAGQTCILSVVQDVTERRLAEDALRQSEEKFASAFQGSPNLVAITSLDDGEIIDINRGFERLSGFSRSDVIGRRTLELNLWGTAEDREEFVRQIRSEGRVTAMEVKLRTRAGEEKVGLISAQPIVVDARECVITVIQDVTSRKRAEEALQDYAKRLQTLRDIDAAILKSDSVEAIVTGATRPMFMLPGCIHVGCYTRDVQGRGLRLIGGHSRREYSPESMDVAEHESVLAPVLEGRSLVVKDAAGASSSPSRAFAGLGRDTGIGSFFMVPLTVKGQHIGVLSVVFDRPHAFRDGHVDLAREIANPVALAIERMRLQDELRRTNARLTALSQKLVETQESERRHLAHELHDHIGQMLTAAKLSLQQARRLAKEASLASALDEHVEIISDTLEEVRSLSLNLRPSLLDDFGLVPALKWLVERSSAEDGLQISLHADPGMARLRSDAEVTCFRVIQEALSNALRHAGASKIVVSVERTFDRVILGIVDDGCGFETDVAFAQASSGSSLGLLSMEERVRLVGGTLDVQSVVGEGTIIRAELPILDDSSQYS